jgi:hypothetical protein
MQIEKYLKSDDIEIVGLYADVFLKQNKDIKKLSSVLGDQYSIVRDFDKFILVKTYAFASPSGWSSYNAIITHEEEYALQYKEKEHKVKIPMYNSFLTPKNKLKYGHKRNARIR